MAVPTKDQAIGLLRYDPRTGKLYWRETRGRRVKGVEAGWIDKDGYRLVRINGRLCRAHHVVWLIETGAWPRGDVDHADHDVDNNRFGNLRDCPHASNLKNMQKHRDNTSGFKGVYRQANSGSWFAQIMADGKLHYLGSHRTAVAAARAYDAAAVRLHGEFALINGVN